MTPMARNINGPHKAKNIKGPLMAKNTLMFCIIQSSNTLSQDKWKNNNISNLKSVSRAQLTLKKVVASFACKRSLACKANYNQTN